MLAHKLPIASKTGIWQNWGMRPGADMDLGHVVAGDEFDGAMDVDPGDFSVPEQPNGAATIFPYQQSLKRKLT